MQIRLALCVTLLTAAAGALCPAAGEEPARPFPIRPTTLEALLEIGGPPRIVAHRGFSGRSPENTLTAVRAAIDVGADMVEVDVRLTADGQLVCLHDEKVDRTTDGRGRLRTLTLAQVKLLDAGSWFSRSHARERVPTLGQVLETARGRALVNVELKGDVAAPGEAKRLASATARLLRARDMHNQVIVSSFEPALLRWIRQVDAGIATASIYNRRVHRGRDPVAVMEAAGSTAFIIAADRVTPAIVDRCHSHGLPVGVYVVNSERALRRALELNADLIFTDRPDHMLRLVAGR